MHKILKADIGGPIPGIVDSTKTANINNVLNSYNNGIKQGIAPMKSGIPTKSRGIKNMSGGLQAGLSAASSILGGLSSGNLTAEQSAAREGLRSAISSAGPIGAAIGAASSVVDTLGAVTGLNLDNIDKDVANRAGISGAAGVTNFFNSLPGVSMLAGMFGSKTAKSYKSAEIDQLTNAYGGTTADINAAQKLGRKRMLFGKRKANRFIRNQNRKNELLTDIGLDAKIAKSNSAVDSYTSQNQNIYSGYTPQLLLSREGMKFPELDEARKLINSWSNSTKLQKNLQKFQIGGKMNLIPEGVLHARKHDLEAVNPELEGQITKKGIPVVTHSEGGITQTAEIEKEEWTLRKEFTDKLEELYKSYQENKSDEIAIEAGKLICYELLKNTDDRSGLIKSVK